MLVDERLVVGAIYLGVNLVPSNAQNGFGQPGKKKLHLNFNAVTDFFGEEKLKTTYLPETGGDPGAGNPEVTVTLAPLKRILGGEASSTVCSSVDQKNRCLSAVVSLVPSAVRTFLPLLCSEPVVPPPLPTSPVPKSFWAPSPCPNSQT